MSHPDALLEISNLSVEYRTFDGIVKAVNSLELVVRPGETVGLVGETGAGKTTTALAIMRLLPPRVSHVTSGEIRFDGKDLLKLSDRAMEGIRGNKISMVFQNPLTSLNPVFTVEQQIVGVLARHQGLSGEAAARRAGDLLEMVGISRKRVRDYPHQFSGGMRQRVSIAIALACNPHLLIADEPTTALDVTIQAQVLHLMGELKRKLSTSTILITHDLGVVAENCDSVAVMYAGSIVERAPVKDLFENPLHPYTKGLFGSLPDIDVSKKRLQPIPGSPPDPMVVLPGCSFGPRCPIASDGCRGIRPRLQEIESGHFVACEHPGN
jgi:peptide/nickel transport system ATP-binding protein